MKSISRHSATALLGLIWAVGCGVSDATVSLDKLDAGKDDAGTSHAGASSGNAGASHSSGGRGTGGSTGGTSGKGGATGGTIGAGGQPGTGGVPDASVGGPDGAPDSSAEGGADEDAGPDASGSGGTGTGGAGNGGTSSAGGAGGAIGAGGKGNGGTLGAGGVRGTGGRGAGGAQGAGGAAPTCTKVDCTNPACVDDVCLDAAPGGWTGPIELYEGTSAGAPTCAAPFSSFQFKLYSGLGGTAASCSACSCGTGQVYCGFGAQATGSGGGCSCSSSCTYVNMKNDGACVGWPGGGANPSIYLDFSASTGPLKPGSCPLLAGASPDGPTPTWSTAAVGCALPFPSSNGCGSGSVCSRIPEAPFNGKLCVYQSGDVACPAVRYTTKRLYYADYSDTRGCTGCTCSYKGPTCVGQGVQIQTFSDGSCNSLSNGSFPFQNCSASAAGVGSFRVSMADMPVSACGAAAGDGQPNGAVTATNPTTVCCTP